MLWITLVGTLVATLALGLTLWQTHDAQTRENQQLKDRVRVLEIQVAKEDGSATATSASIGSLTASTSSLGQEVKDLKEMVTLWLQRKP